MQDPQSEFVALKHYLNYFGLGPREFASMHMPMMGDMNDQCTEKVTKYHNYR